MFHHKLIVSSGHTGNGDTMSSSPENVFTDSGIYLSTVSHLWSCGMMRGLCVNGRAVWLNEEISPCSLVPSLHHQRSVWLNKETSLD